MAEPLEGDSHRSLGELYGLACTAVTDLEFLNLTAESSCNDLGSHADTLYRNCTENIFDGFNGFRCGKRIPRTVGQEKCLRFVCKNHIGRRSVGVDVEVGTAVLQALQNGFPAAEIKNCDLFAGIRECGRLLCR